MLEKTLLVLDTKEMVVGIIGRLRSDPYLDKIKMNYTWTKEFPTVPGWYWVYGGFDEENIQLLLPYAIEKQMVWSERRDEYIRISEFKNFQFAGPISNPSQK